MKRFEGYESLGDFILPGSLSEFTCGGEPGTKRDASHLPETHHNKRQRQSHLSSFGLGDEREKGVDTSGGLGVGDEREKGVDTSGGLGVGDEREKGVDTCGGLGVGDEREKGVDTSGGLGVGDEREKGVDTSGETGVVVDTSGNGMDDETGMVMDTSGGAGVGDKTGVVVDTSGGAGVVETNTSDSVEDISMHQEGGGGSSGVTNDSMPGESEKTSDQMDQVAGGWEGFGNDEIISGTVNKENGASAANTLDSCSTQESSSSGNHYFLYYLLLFVVICRACVQVVRCSWVTVTDSFVTVRDALNACALRLQCIDMFRVRAGKAPSPKHPNRTSRPLDRTPMSSLGTSNVLE
jgi:hypothetical protein